MDRFHVITGAPGTGKTAILEALAGDFAVVPEPARRVLAAWRAEGNPRPAQMDPGLMIEQMIALSIDDYATAIAMTGPVVFDRGVVDAVAYALHLGCDPAGPLASLADHRYNSHVLLTTPWREIYSTDEERTMDFADVEMFHASVVLAYENAGHELIEIPRGSVAERVGFVRRHIAAER